MTDNEKAATFIGWQLHKAWDGGPDFPLEPIPAPDMSDPRNYMKALCAVRDKGYTWSLGGDPEWMQKASRERHPDTGGDQRVCTVAFWGWGKLVKETYADSITNDPALTVVKALAALYDAELAAANNPTPHKESQ